MAPPPTVHGNVRLRRWLPPGGATADAARLLVGADDLVTWRRHRLLLQLKWLRLKLLRLERLLLLWTTQWLLLSPLRLCRWLALLLLAGLGPGRASSDAVSSG
jgi:hypothetical protein